MYTKTQIMDPAVQMSIRWPDLPLCQGIHDQIRAAIRSTIFGVIRARSLLVFGVNFVGQADS